MRPTRTLLLFIIGATLAMMALPAHALEGEYFMLSGTVTDANWNPISGADVVLYDNYVDRVINSTTTDQNGNFAFEHVTIKTNLCTVGVSYTEGGTTYKIPGYNINHYPANGVQKVDLKDTHFNDYYLIGSTPQISATPTVAPTATAVPTPLPITGSDNSPVPSILLFLGGSISGAVVATLACFIVLRPPKRP